MKRKRGFTLPEVVVALSITIIVMSLVASLIVIVSKTSSNQNNKNEYDHEYTTANNIIENYFNAYNTSSYEIQTVENQSIVITDDGTNEYILSFDLDKKILSANIIEHLTGEVSLKTLQLEKMTEIKFSKNGNIILCEYVFDSGLTYKNLITFGV